MSEILALIEELLALLRSAGPGYFFTAMILLPAIGVPMLVFLLPAVPLFAGELGVVPVVAICLACVTANMALSWAVARRGLRPLLARLVARLGYRLPEVGSADVTDLIVILRVTPGIPFCVQNYLAGMAQAPFARYMIVSCIVVWPLNVAIMLFSDSLLQGKGKVALITFGLLVAVIAATHLVRRHFAARARDA